MSYTLLSVVNTTAVFDILSDCLLVVAYNPVDIACSEWHIYY